MPVLTPNRQTFSHRLRVLAGLFLMALSLVLLAGCGSTKVYTANKTIVYGGSLYNMGNVQRIGSRVEGQLPDGSTVDMGAMDKKGVEALLKQHQQITVSTVVVMDDQDMPYQRGAVKRYSDYDKLVKRLRGAQGDINKFMKDKQKTQLKLK